MCGVQDVYSFGVVLWEMMTWKIPFAEENHWQVSWRISVSLVIMILPGGPRVPPRHGLCSDRMPMTGRDSHVASLVYSNLTAYHRPTMLL